MSGERSERRTAGQLDCAAHLASLLEFVVEFEEDSLGRHCPTCGSSLVRPGGYDDEQWERVKDCLEHVPGCDRARAIRAAEMAVDEAGL